jgi:hypothetical protein
MHDNAQFQATSFSLTTQEEILSERLITRGLWPPRSSGLHPCNCSLVVVVGNNAQSLQEVSPLAPELNPFAQRFLPRFYTGDFSFKIAHCVTSL